MASPQKENGHIQISTELWEAWSKIRVSGEAEQILKVIIRKTYGFNKKEDAISLSQFASATGFMKQTVIKALAKLRQMNLITQKGNEVANIYSFNKDYDTWLPLPKKVTQPKKVTSVTQKGKNRNPKSDIQKTVTIDTITKDRGTPAQEARDFFNNPDKQAKMVLTLISKGLNENVARREVAKFINHWTELNKQGTKQKWELQPTFEIKRRLVTWFSNAEKWSKEINQRKVIKL